MKECNPGWFRGRKNCTSLFIFVHGLNSTASTCWTGDSNSWPNIIVNDDRFNNFDIFLSEYYTTPRSGDFGLADCADQLAISLRNTKNENDCTPISYQNIIFIAHSFGGIVTRYWMDNNTLALKGKRIGLVLMASPSTGSIFANFAQYITKFVSHQQRDELAINSPILVDLDKRFKRLLHNQERGFDLVGTEAYENKKMGLFKIVSKSSAARYFGETSHVPNSTHSSIVKPNDGQHHSHQVLIDFCNKNFNCKTIPVLPAGQDGGPLFDSHPAISSPLPTTNTLTELEKALFDIYCPEFEKYYYQRDIDTAVAETVGLRSLWIYGKSGVGKTSILRRLSTGCPEAVHIYMANCQRPISQSLLKELTSTVAARVGQSWSDQLDEKWLISALSRISTANGVILYIDEVPIDFQDDIENAKIAGIFSNILNQLKLSTQPRRVGFAAASIHNPYHHGQPENTKFSEFFQILEVPEWTPHEISDLRKLITDTVEFEPNLTQRIAEIGPIKTSTPRRLKTAITDLLIKGI